MFQSHITVCVWFFFFFNDTATTEIYTLSLHDALPIGPWPRLGRHRPQPRPRSRAASARSEEHTSELQSRPQLVCRLLLEKKKNKTLVCKSGRRAPHHTRARRRGSPT